MQACVLFADIYIYIYIYMYVYVYVYTFSHINKHKASIEKSNTYCALWAIGKKGKIEIQYLFDGLECLLLSKLSLYAFWQQSLLIETEQKKRVFFLACSLLHAK